MPDLVLIFNFQDIVLATGLPYRGTSNPLLIEFLTKKLVLHIRQMTEFSWVSDQCLHAICQAFCFNFCDDLGLFFKQSEFLHYNYGKSFFRLLAEYIFQPTKKMECFINFEHNFNAPVREILVSPDQLTQLFQRYNEKQGFSGRHIRGSFLKNHSYILHQFQLTFPLFQIRFLLLYIYVFFFVFVLFICFIFLYFIDKSMLSINSVYLLERHFPKGVLICRFINIKHFLVANNTLFFRFSQFQFIDLLVVTLINKVPYNFCMPLKDPDDLLIFCTNFVNLILVKKLLGLPNFKIIPVFEEVEVNFVKEFLEPLISVVSSEAEVLNFKKEFEFFEDFLFKKRLM